MKRFQLCLALAVLLGSSRGLLAQTPRVLPPGRLPQDARLGDLKTLDDYFPFDPCDTPEQWAARSERVRRQLLVATGLWPMPTKTPANAVLHGKVDRKQYTVQRVYLESFPGHFVTGSLYRPKGYTGPRPGVLSPHGHWDDGRFYDAGPDKIRDHLDAGAERFEPSGRFPLQARCVQLAKMGCVVFQYDMVGYADSVQLEHRSGVRAEMNTAEDWGYFSPQAALQLQNIMGLQTYNSIRALDWFSGLEDVDPNRLAVTGASGGGTQTFMLSAIDPRLAVSFPAVMVSTAMQGGCSCENACYLRVGTGNVEIAALFSPRPLAMSAANDWTIEMETKGLPELEQHYSMLGVDDLVTVKHLDFPHNYNYQSRKLMYAWFNEHLKLGFEGPIVEEDFLPLSREELTVWDREHPKPAGGDAYERSLVRWITADSRRQMAELVPADSESLGRFRKVVGGAVDVMIGRGLSLPASSGSSGPIGELGEAFVLKLLVSNPVHGEEVPAVLLQPKQWNKRAVVWVSEQGKQALFDVRGNPRPAVQKLLAAGIAVVGVDLLGQGEFDGAGTLTSNAGAAEADERPFKKYAGYVFGYNHSLFSRRVHDILSVISVLKNSQWDAEEVDLVGLAGAGHWVAAARAQAADAVRRAVVDTGGFRFAKLAGADDPRASAFGHPDFLPGGAKYLDLPGMLALSAPQPLWLAGEGAQAPEIVAAAYRAAGQPRQLTVFDGEESQIEAAAITWLLR